MAEEHAALHTILAYGNGEVGEEFTKVAQVKDIDGPGITRDTIDVTNHDSEGLEFLASLQDGGEVTFDIEFDPADPSHDQTTGLMALMEETTRRNWRLISPVLDSGSDYHGLAFAAMVTAFKPKFPVLGSMTASITLKVSGKVTQDSFPRTGLC